MNPSKITELEIVAAAQGKADPETEVRVLCAAESDPRLASALAFWRETLPAAGEEAAEARGSADRIARQVRDRLRHAEAKAGPRSITGSWGMGSALAAAALALILAGAWAVGHRGAGFAANPPDSREIAQAAQISEIDPLLQTIREAPMGGTIVVHSGRIAQAIRIDKPLRLERSATAQQ